MSKAGAGAWLAAALVLAGACGGGPAIEGGEGAPGEGVVLRMARANWTTGYFQAALYRNLLQRLGYEVTDPADLELGPNLAYLGMAEGNIDFWVNSWFPNHNSWLQAHMPDGSTVGDHVSRIGFEMHKGALQGYVITKKFRRGVRDSHLG